MAIQIRLRELLENERHRDNIIDVWRRGRPPTPPNGLAHAAPHHRADADDGSDTIPDYLEALARAMRGESGAHEECASVIRERLERRARHESPEQSLLEQARLVSSIVSVWSDQAGWDALDLGDFETLLGETGPCLTTAKWALHQANTVSSAVSDGDLFSALTQRDAAARIAGAPGRLRAFAALAAKHCGADRVQLLLANGALTTLRCEATSCREDMPFDVPMTPDTSCFELDTFHQEGPTWLNGPGHMLSKRNPVSRFENAQVLGVPLNQGDRTMGVLLLVWKAAAERNVCESLCRSLLPLATYHVRAVLQEDEHRKEIARLKAEGALRERFISMLAHDLRGPVSTTRLAAQQMLALNETSSRLQLLLYRVLGSADRASEMIRDLLDVAHVQWEGSMPIHRQPTDVRQLCLEVIEELEGQYVAHFELKAPRPVEGCYDTGSLRRSVWNLLCNAIKHGDLTQPIVVTVVSTGPGVRIDVHNQGEPIDPSEQGLIFEPFRQLASGGRGGWGLGLPLVRACARAHGGDVTVTSREGEGTTFSMALEDGPRARLQRETATEAPSETSSMAAPS